LVILEYIPGKMDKLEINVALQIKGCVFNFLEKASAM